MSATASVSFGPFVERWSYQRGLDQNPSTSYDSRSNAGCSKAHFGRSCALASHSRASGTSGSGVTTGCRSTGFSWNEGVCALERGSTPLSGFGWWQYARQESTRPEWDWRELSRKGLRVKNNSFALGEPLLTEPVQGFTTGFKHTSGGPFQQLGVASNIPGAPWYPCCTLAPNQARLERKPRVCRTRASTKGEAEAVDLDSLDLEDPESANIIRAAKVAQLERLSPEELRALPRKERLIPKKRQVSRVSDSFLRLGDSQKLEKIRKTLRPKKGVGAEAKGDGSVNVGEEGGENGGDEDRSVNVGSVNVGSVNVGDESGAEGRESESEIEEEEDSGENEGTEIGVNEGMESGVNAGKQSGPRRRGKGRPKTQEESIAALLTSEMDDDDRRLNRVKWGRNSMQFGFSAAHFASTQMNKLLKDGLEELEEKVGDLKNEMRPAAERRKYTVAAHFKAHEGSAQAMIRKVIRMWDAGEFIQDAKVAKQDSDPVVDVEYGLSYDASRLHVPFQTHAQDAFQEMLALQPEEREHFFHQGFLDVLNHNTAGAQMSAFREVFFKTLITRAKAVNRYCQTLFDFDDLQVDNSSLDMAVYLTRFSPRNYKNPEDISAIVATVESRLNVFRAYLHINRALAVVLLISYPRYLLPSCDLEKNVKDMLQVLERLEYDNENIVKLVFKNPSLFTLPLQRTANNIRLLQAFGLAESEYATKLRWLIGSNLMHRLAERVIILRKFGVPDCDIPRCFQRNIYLFLTTTATMSKHLSYLTSLGRGTNWVCELVVARPKVLNYSLERQAIRLQESLKKVGVELSHEKLVDLIVVNSPLYATSSKKFDAFLKYLTQDLGLSPQVFLEFPSSVGYSLEGRVKPRVNICRSVGIVIADVGQPGLSLAQVLVTKFTWFKHKIESGIWLRKYGGGAKELEYDETGQWVAAAQEEELEEEEKGEGGTELPASGEAE